MNPNLERQGTRAPPDLGKRTSFERLVTVSQQTGDPRLASAKLHPRKKTASFTHADVRWIECVFDTNRICGKTPPQLGLPT